jgi:hypothetical protein
MSEIKNPKLHQLSLQAGGSHYPSINPDMQTAFAKMIIDECIKAINDTKIVDIVRTTYDHNMAEGVKQRCTEAVKQHFGV